MQPGERVRVPGVLWFSLRAQWVFGLLPLVVLTEISRPALAVATSAFAVGAFLDWMGNTRRGWHRAATPLLVAGALATVADLVFGSGDLLVSVSLLLLGVQSIKFLLPKTIGDGWQLCAISFLEFLAAAASTTEIQFAVFLFLFLGLSVGAMWALQTEESAEAGGTAPRARPGFAFAMLLLSALAGLLLTALLFVLTPRIGIGQFLHRQESHGGLTGFSDAISLRDVTSVKADRRVVARIEFPELAAGVSPSGLYLRGGTYVRFDGTKWSRVNAALARVPRAGLHYFLSPRPAIPLSSAEIYLEPTGHSALFVYPGAVTVEGALGEIRTDGGGNYRLSGGDSAVRYHLHFSPEGLPRKSRISGPGDAYLALPPGADRIRELARQVTSGAKSDGERAELARRFFLDGFRYSLTDVASSVEEFLFRKRKGFCEHYAAGLTLLLRAAGIPARIAAGYLGGEWSDVGKYLIVRQSDAHAWTEAWIGGRWVTVDATPSLGENNPFFSRTGMIGMYIDWTMQRWNKYVVNYSLRMQAEAVSGGWFALRRARKRFRGTIRSMGGGNSLAVAGFGLALATLLLAWRARRRVPSPYPCRPGEGKSPLPRPYARLLRRLSATCRRGSAGASFEELLRESAERTPALLPETVRFLSLYHRERFGPCPLPAEESAEAGRLADLLLRRLFRPGNRQDGNSRAHGLHSL
jgi:transglutaminase-like putative cysteine protease